MGNEHRCQDFIRQSRLPRPETKAHLYCHSPSTQTCPPSMTTSLQKRWMATAKSGHYPSPVELPARRGTSQCIYPSPLLIFKFNDHKFADTNTYSQRTANWLVPLALNSSCHKMERGGVGRVRLWGHSQILGSVHTQRTRTCQSYLGWNVYGGMCQQNLKISFQNYNTLSADQQFPLGAAQIWAKGAWVR